MKLHIDNFTPFYFRKSNTIDMNITFKIIEIYAFNQRNKREKKWHIIYLSIFLFYLFSDIVSVFLLCIILSLLLSKSNLFFSMF